MRYIKGLCLVLIGIFIGMAAVKNQAIISILKIVKWSNMVFWLSICLGSIVPILINHYSIKRQEVIKLKAKFAQDKIDIIRKYNEFSIFMRSTLMLEKDASEKLLIDYEQTPQDKSAPSLRGLLIMQSHEEYSEWKVNYLKLSDQLLSLGSCKINDYQWFINHYLLNLEYAINDIPDERMWAVSVVIKNDFFNICSEFSEIIDEYLNHTVYKFRYEKSKKKGKVF